MIYQTLLVSVLTTIALGAIGGNLWYKLGSGECHHRRIKIEEIIASSMPAKAVYRDKSSMLSLK